MDASASTAAGRDLARNPDVVVRDVELVATVLLSRQFRFPVYVNGHPDGMLVETAAGPLDDDDPETAIRREAGQRRRLRTSSRPTARC